MAAIAKSDVADCNWPALKSRLGLNARNRTWADSGAPIRTADAACAYNAGTLRTRPGGCALLAMIGRGRACCPGLTA